MEFISTPGNYLLLNVLISQQPPLGPDFRRDCGREDGSNRASWGPLISCQVLARSQTCGVGRTSKVLGGRLWALYSLLTAYVLVILNRNLTVLKALNGPVKYR